MRSWATDSFVRRFTNPIYMKIKLAFGEFGRAIDHGIRAVLRRGL